MNKRFTQIFLAGMLAAFITGTVITPAVTPVYAAEQTVEQDRQNPPVDAPQGDQNAHAGHHATN